MNIKSLINTASLIVAGAFMSMTAHAVVVSNTNVLFKQAGSYGDIDPVYETIIYQNTSGDYTGMLFSKTDNQDDYVVTLRTITYNVDESSDYYLVPFGAEFSARTIAAGSFPALLTLDAPGSVDVGYWGTGDFFLGINTGIGFTDYKPNREVFGWIQLEYTPTSLKMIGNAVAYGESGIYVGTLTPVPLPPAHSLFLAGIALFCFLKIRAKRIVKGLRV